MAPKSPQLHPPQAENTSWPSGLRGALEYPPPHRVRRVRHHLKVLEPLLYPPQPARAFRRADPKKSTMGPSKNASKKHSIFERLLAPKMIPKASQNRTKMEPKFNNCLYSFSHLFSIVFGRRFCRFAGCWTFDLTTIYSVFVGAGIFRKV